MTMPTRYQIEQYKRYGLLSLISVIAVILFGNIITYTFTKKVQVNPESYILKQGLPFFKSADDYLNFIESYPYNPGVCLNMYTAGSSETIWKIGKKFGISIETLIAANPHMKNLEIQKGDRLVVPSADGTLLVCDDDSDVDRYAGMYTDTPDVKGRYSPGLFTIFSPDDLRIVFFQDTVPAVVNESIEKLYSYMLPFSAPVKGGFFTSMFGERVNPFLHFGMEFHNGIDIAARLRTPIKAACSGMVFFAGWRDGFGNTVIIQHDDGYTTLYGHCTKLFVQAGQWVKKGELIASVGSTGRSTGPHLHYTVFRHGKPLNPIKFLW